jgi:hypothetical protein
VKKQTQQVSHTISDTIKRDGIASNDRVLVSKEGLMNELNFESVLKRIYEFQSKIGPLLFETEIENMEIRLNRAQEVLERQMESIGREFATYWQETTNDSRLEMIEKCCQWLGLMRGSEWCGINGSEWMHQGKLFVELCSELRERTDVVMEMQLGGNSTYCMKVWPMISFLLKYLGR